MITFKRKIKGNEHFYSENERKLYFFKRKMKGHDNL